MEENRLQLIHKTQEYLDELDKEIAMLKQLKEDIIPSYWHDLNSFKNSTRDFIWKERFTSADLLYIKETHKGLKEVLFKI